MRRIAAALTAGALAVSLTGCAGAQDTQQEQAGQQNDVQQEQKTANVGDPVTYESAQGAGEFVVTVDGLERSMELERQNADNPYMDQAEGYWECMLMLTVEDVSVEMEPESPTYLSKVWMEDEDGVKMSSSSSGPGYGEYEAAPQGMFRIAEGQTIRIAIPYTLPEGATEYTVVIDGTEVPVTMVESDRPLS